MGNGIHIIKASAGSGKTYTLAKDYIKLLIAQESPQLLRGGSDRLKLLRGGDNHEHILAITFTNAATSEMKQRIVEQLFLLGQGDGSRCNYCDDFKKEFEYRDFGEVQSAARRALSGILFNYNSFSVSTIDSFFQTILRTFARELDCDYNYEIQLDTKYALTVAVHNMLAKLGSGSQLDSWVEEFIKSSISERKDSGNIYGAGTAGDLVKFAQTLSSEQYGSQSAGIRQYLQGKSGGRMLISTFRKRLIALRNNAATCWMDSVKSAIDELHSIPGADDKMSKGKALRKLLDAESNLLPNRVEDYEVKLFGKEFWDKFCCDASKYYNKGAKPDTISEVDSRVMPKMQEAIEARLRHKGLTELLSALWNVGLLGAIDEELEAYRKDNNLILMSDTNSMVSKVIDSGVPFMYEHVGTWINNYMIDEFQDTSRQQYENFKQLLDDSIGNGHNSLIIGDEKQCIYRFRNSDPELLLHQLEDDFSGCHSRQSLDTNFRSRTNVVDFNNRFFTAMISRYRTSGATIGFATLQSTYASIEQKVSPHNANKHKGYVEVNVMHKSQGSSATPEQYVLERVPELIVELRQRGYRLHDIGILVNRRKEGNKVVESILDYNDTHVGEEGFEPIQIMSAESLLLLNSPQVRLIVSVLRFLDSTHLSGAAAGTSNDGTNEADGARAAYVHRMLGNQRLYSVVHDFECSVARQRATGDNVQQVDGNTTPDYGSLLAESFAADARQTGTAEEKARVYAAKMARLLPDGNTEPMSITTIVDRIIKEYVLADGNGRLSEQQVGTTFMLAFQNLVTDFATRSTSGTVREFLQFWDENKDRLAVNSPGDADAVQVMTIHKSKGLQFKCVIIPHAEWDMVDQREGVIWVDRQEWLKDYSGSFNGSEQTVPPLVPMTRRAVSASANLQHITDKMNQESLIDNVNKTYVAFTRAERELYIFACSPSSSKKDVPPLGCEIESIMPGFDIAGEKLAAKVGDDELQVQQWAIGEQEESIVAAKAGTSGVEAVAMPQYYVGLSSSEVVKVSLPEFETAEQQSGNTMHRLLSRVRTAADVDRALRFALTRGIVTNEPGQYWDTRRISATLHRLVTDERTRSWFANDNRVYNERSITYQGPSHDQRHARPDRVVRRPDGSWVVVDYKTGDNETNDNVARYRKQVAGYMDKIRKSAGGAAVEGYVVFLRSWHIVKVQ